MKLLKNKVFYTLCLFSLITFACSKNSNEIFSDHRVLGSIDGTEYTVGSFAKLLLNYNNSQVEEKIPDEKINQIFNLYAQIYVMSKLSDETNLFASTDKKNMLDAQTEDIRKKLYFAYFENKVLNPIQKDLKLNKKDIEPYKKRVQVRHILIKDQDQYNNLKETILQDLKNGVKFEELTAKYSEDPGSKNSGGLIPQWIYPSTENFDPGFKEGALKAKENKEIIPDIKSSFGTHILYVENVQTLSLKEIEANDPILYKNLLENKKNLLYNEVLENMKKKYTIDSIENINIVNLSENYPNSKDTVLLSLKNKDIEYTFQNFINEMFLGNIKEFQNLVKEKKVTDEIFTAELFPRISQELMVKAEVKTDIQKDKDFEDFMNFQTNLIKGNFYIDSIVGKEVPKKTYTVTEKEVLDFFNTNKDKMSSDKNVSLTNDMKKEIREIIIRMKQQEDDIKQQVKIQELIQTEANKYYSTYNISFNEDFIKTDNNVPAEEQPVA